ncbi:hypothetical protein JCM8547_007647 [Rhodosporidiobolus lusitaniae]
MSTPSPTPPSSGSATLCSRVDCTPIFLPILLGVLLSSLLLGMCLVSSFRFLSLFPDPRFARKRALVVAVALVQVVQTTMDLVRVLLIFTLHYGDPLYFLHPRWYDALAPFFSVLLQLQTQAFLLSRAHQYAGVAGVEKRVKWAGTVALGALIAVSGACGCAAALEIKLLNSLARLSPGHPQAPLLNIVAPAWLVSSAFIDITLCSIITHELLSARRAANGLSSFSSQRTLGVLKRLVRVVLRSGIVLAVVQTATAVIWLVEARTGRGKTSSSWVYLPIILLSKFYTLTYLALLLAPRRTLRSSSFGTSSSFALTTPLPPAHPGIGGQDGVLPPLTESRRRLFPPSPVPRSPYEIGGSRWSGYDEQGGGGVDRPGAPTPRAGNAASYGRLPPQFHSFSFEQPHQHHILGHDEEEEENEDGEDEGGLMEEDSPVSPGGSFFPDFGQHFQHHQQQQQQQHLQHDSFGFQPQPLHLVPYTFGTVGVTSSSRSVSSHGHSGRQPHPYQESPPLSSKRNGAFLVHPDHLPPTPPLSPHAFDGGEDVGGESFVYAPSSPLHSSSFTPLSPPPRAAFPDSIPLPLPSPSPSPHPSSSSPSSSPADALRTRATKSRMHLPHPPLSTVDEGSTPPRSGRLTGEWGGTATVATPGYGTTMEGTPSRGSWVALGGPGEVDRENGDGEEEGEREERLVEPAGGREEERSHPLPESLTIFPPPVSAPPNEPYSFPSTPPSSRPFPQSLVLSSLSSLDTGEPPRSPRLVERRGAVDLLPAMPGVALRMEPREEEGWVFPPPMVQGGGGGGGKGGKERRREYGKIEVGEGQEKSRPPPFSHFSSPSSSSSSTLPASLSSVPPPPGNPSPSFLKSRSRHCFHPSTSTTHTQAHDNGSDTTLDAVLRALRAPLPPSQQQPGTSSSFRSSPSSHPFSSSSDSLPAPLRPAPSPLQPPQQQKKRRRGGGGFVKHARMFSGSKASSLALARTSSSGSTFGCRDAMAVSRGQEASFPPSYRSEEKGKGKEVVREKVGEVGEAGGLVVPVLTGESGSASGSLRSGSSGVEAGIVGF